MNPFKQNASAGNSPRECNVEILPADELPAEEEDRFVHGNGWSDGKHYLFGSQGILVARFWPEPRAWMKGPPDWKWRGIRPELGVVEMRLAGPSREPGFTFARWGKLYCPRRPSRPVFRPARGLSEAGLAHCRGGYEGSLRHHERAAAAFRSIPAEMRTVVGGFRFRQWSLLRICAAAPEFAELARSNPGLAVGIANAGVFRRRRCKTEAVRRVLLIPRRRKCGWLGFPASESAARILSRMPPGGLGIIPLLVLRKILADAETSRRLSHLPCLHPVVLMLMLTRSYGPCATDSLLREVSAEAARRRDFTGTARLLADCHYLTFSCGRLPSRLHSLDQLRAWHGRQVRNLRRGKNRDLLGLEFPPPPFSGGVGIEPIPDARSLMEEGIEQNNCVFGFAPQIAEGRAFIYRVTFPERATLAVERCGGGWELGQLSARANTPVGMRTQRHAERWFANALGKMLKRAAGSEGQADCSMAPAMEGA